MYDRRRLRFILLLFNSLKNYLGDKNGCIFFLKNTQMRGIKAPLLEIRSPVLHPFFNQSKPCIILYVIVMFQQEVGYSRVNSLHTLVLMNTSTHEVRQTRTSISAKTVLQPREFLNRIYRKKVIQCYILLPAIFGKKSIKSGQ